MAGTLHNGTVVETSTAGVYTYMEIEEDGKKFWVASPPNEIAKGEKVNFTEELWMPNFTSKALDKTFERILFVNRVNVGVATAPPANKITPVPAAAPPELKGPAVAYTVAELYAKNDELNGKLVKVTGKVIKATPSIMGRNWIHITDGTGAGDTAKVVFTSREMAALGTTVVAEGVLAASKDFGGGYFYEVIVENSSFTNAE
jgi:hypothetical protein